MNRTSMHAMLVAAVATVLAGSAVGAPSTVGLDRSQAQITRAAAGMPLTAASNAAPQSIVAGYLQSRGRTPDVLASLRTTSTSVSHGVTHVRLEQQVDGLSVYGAYAKAAINAQGELVQVIDRLAAISLVRPSRIDAEQALAAAVNKLHPGQAAGLRVAAVTGNTTTFAGNAFFYRNPTVTAVVLPLENGTLARGWLVETWTADRNQLHHTAVDGEGQVLDVELRTNTDSYNVFVEDPLKGAQTVVNGPGAANAQSPAGWLSGAQSTVNIRGNNVSAYLDTDANNAPDSGGTAVTSGNFLAAADLTASPGTTSNKAVAAQNLFYLNNVMHDVLYSSGFVEGEGNFQVNNFGKGGNGNDPVNAEAQDGSGTDNANFATPSDGSSPRMQMYLWNSTVASAEVVVNGVSYGAFPAAFGAALTTTGITASLKVVPTDACTALTAGSMSNATAIVDRGGCNFTVKVLNAQNAGAKAVLIANNDPNGGAFGPGGTDRKVKIPSAMVTYADGATLKSLANSSSTLRKKSTAPIMIDGDLDADIVFHEYGHGLTWRMIGSMSGPLAGAIGEGASDVVAFLVNGDDRVGEYAYGNPIGIRRYPYDGYPLTYSAVTGAEVHNDGEIYAAAMWRVRTNYLNSGNGLTVDDVLTDFVDGMIYTPSAPSFEKMRDGMLQSIAVQFGANETTRTCAVWRGFADTGIGVGASGTVSRRGTVTIVESFTVPSACQ